MYQAFRGPNGTLEYLEATQHTPSGQNVIFIDDIESLFPGFAALRKGPVTVTKARDANYKYINPPCIRYQPDTTLDVVIKEDVSSIVVESTAILSPSFSPKSISLNEDRMNLSLQDDIEVPENDVQAALETLTLQSISELPSISNSTSLTNPIDVTSAPATDKESSPSSHQLLQRTQLMLQDSSAQLQVYEHTVKAGQLPQAGVIMEGIEVIQQELRGNFSRLHSEMSKNEHLQNQIFDMQKTAEQMAQRILELQLRAIEMQRQALDRLALIQNKVAAIMTQTYELHEYPIPRLFIVLPIEELSMTEKLGKGLRNIFATKFRLYFLCECGEHTKQPDDSTDHTNGEGTTMLKHEIHIARHEGYDLDHPTEFFEKYGSYVLTLLQMIKYGITIAGIVVPPIAQLRVSDEVDALQKSTESLLTNLGIRVNSAIDYLQGLSGNPDQSSSSPLERESEEAISHQLNGLEALEGADLRQLGTFLRNKDDARVFGNLYRIVTTEGHVKWVCLDHYRHSYKSKAMKELRDVVESNDGLYDENTGRVIIKLASPIAARQFYSALAQSRFVTELEISLLWETTLQDLQTLKDAIQHSNIVHLKLTGSGGQGPLSDILNRTRRSDPIIQLMAVGKVRAISIHDNDGFLERISKVPTYLHIRMLDFGQSILLRTDLRRLAMLIPVSPQLSMLVLRVGDLDDAAEIIHKSVQSSNHAIALTLKLATDDHQKAILRFKPYSGSIQTIELVVSDIKDTGLSLNPAVQLLSITNNSGIVRTKELIQIAFIRYTGLQSIKLSCKPYYFYELLEFIRKTSLSSNFTSLQHVHLFHNAENELITDKLHDPDMTIVKLDIISTAGSSDSWGGVNSLFQHFGSEIQGLDLDMCLSYVQAERFLQCIKQVRRSKLQEVTWKVYEYIDSRVFPVLAQIFEYCDPSSPTSFSSTLSSSSSPSSSAPPDPQDPQWSFIMMLDMFRSSDTQVNLQNAHLFDNKVVLDAMGSMLKHRVTRLILRNMDLDKMVTGLKSVGCEGPFDQLIELSLDYRTGSNSPNHNNGAAASSTMLNSSTILWIQSLIQRSSLPTNSHSKVDANGQSLQATGKQKRRQAFTTLTFQEVNLSVSDWKILIKSIDFLTIRYLTLWSETFTNDMLTALVDAYLETVTSTKRIEERLCNMGLQSNLTPDEERAVHDLRMQEGHGTDGQEKPARIRVLKNRATWTSSITMDHLIHERERLSRG
ncbi:hypothetical protein FBU30_007020, partial [Linnemannia zychae]